VQNGVLSKGNVKYWNVNVSSVFPLRLNDIAQKENYFIEHPVYNARKLSSSLKI
jgi:hypothetical protein